MKRELSFLAIRRRIERGRRLAMTIRNHPEFPLFNRKLSISDAIDLQAYYEEEEKHGKVS